MDAVDEGMLDREKDPAQRLGNVYHMAGIIPVAGHQSDFGFQWDNALMPVGENYTAIERSIRECATAGCHTIWIVCNPDISPLIRDRVGEGVHDPLTYGYARRYDPIPQNSQKIIPIYYVPIAAKDIGRIDCYAWSIVHGAVTSWETSREMSKWVTPEKYFVSFPLGVHNSFSKIKKARQDIRKKGTNWFLSHDGKTAKDGEHLSFSISGKDLVECRKVIRAGTGKYLPGLTYEELTGDKEDWEKSYPLEERWSARHFSLDKVLEPVIIEGAKLLEASWYYDITTWYGYTRYFSQRSRTTKRPTNGTMKHHVWHGLGVDDENDENDNNEE